MRIVSRARRTTLNGRPKRRPVAAAAMLLYLAGLIAAVAGCVTEQVSPGPWGGDKVTLYAEDKALGFEPIFGRYAVDPALGGDLGAKDRPDPSDLFKPFHLFARNTYLHNDGSVTLHYYVEPALGNKLAALLVSQVPGLTPVQNGVAPAAVNQVSVFPSFVMDKRESSGAVTTRGSFMAHQHGTKEACDLLLVRASNETLADIDRFIRRFLVEVPLVEVKVRILEVDFSDNIQWGITSNITKETTGDPFIKQLTTHLNTQEMLAGGGFDVNDLLSWFDPERADVQPDFEGGFFIVEGVHDKLHLQAALEILQRSSKTEVLSAPKVRVLNGHKAIVETISEIPIPKAVVTVTATQYQYEYKTIGVTLAIVPMQLADGSLQIQLTTNVSAVTGRMPFTTGQGTGLVSIPVISERGASTVINVKEDQAFMLAGLITRNKIDVVSKVPLLGDIPLLGFLFKSKDVETKRTQLIFYIEPRIIPPTEVVYGLEY